jgi:hypothetical protein
MLIDYSPLMTCSPVNINVLPLMHCNRFLLLLPFQPVVAFAIHLVIVATAAFLSTTEHYLSSSIVTLLHRMHSASALIDGLQYIATALAHWLPSDRGHPCFRLGCMDYILLSCDQRQSLLADPSSWLIIIDGCLEPNWRPLCQSSIGSFFSIVALAQWMTQRLTIWAQPKTGNWVTDRRPFPNVTYIPSNDATSSPGSSGTTTSDSHGYIL